MKIQGVLLSVKKNDKGFVTLNVEGLRLDAGRSDDRRIESLKALEGSMVEAVVNSQYIKRGDGRHFVRYRLLSIRGGQG